MKFTIEIKGFGTLKDILDNMDEIKSFIENKIEEGEEGILDEAKEIGFPVGDHVLQQKLFLTTSLGKKV